MQYGARRHVDELGRVVIPADMRRTLGWGRDQAVDVLLDGDGVRVIAAGEAGRCRLCQQPTAYRVADYWICDGCRRVLRAALTVEGGDVS